MTSKLVQLDFFKDTEISILEAEIHDVRKSMDKVRKKLFAENGQLRKLVEELSARLEIIEKNICRGDGE